MSAEPPSSRPSRRVLPLWARIARTVLVAFLAATAGAGIYLGATLQGMGERSVEGHLVADLALLAPPVRSALARGDPGDLASLAAAAKADGSVRLTVVLPDGKVVAESDRPLPLANHLDRPEIRDALARGDALGVRHSTTVEDDLLYVARRLDAPDGTPLGVLRLARSLHVLGAMRGELLRVLALAAALGLPIAGLVGWLAARRIARPLEQMTAAAARMAGGDFGSLPAAERPDEAGRLAEALRRMGRQLSATLEASETGRSELRAILESMTEGVLAVGRDEEVLHANRSAAECLGIGRTPAAGSALVESVRVPEITAAVRAALRGEAVPEADVALPGAAGRVLSVSAVPIRTPDGGLHGAVAVLRDVTVVRRLERTRLDFVANVSHELRTPLAAMSSAMETARDLGPGEAAAGRTMAETALRHARRLAAIVDDLLALSQIESEGDRLERVPVPLLRGLRAAAATLAPAAADARVAIELPGPELDGVEVLGHEGRLEQVWTNLLSNAVKYNRAGGSVRVRVDVDRDRREARVAVADTGQGIASEHIPRIFERFYRVDAGRSRDQGGTGLGLAIVKHIVRAHRGRIDVASEPGVGSTFDVTLPLARGGGAPASS